MKYLALLLFYWMNLASAQSFVVVTEFYNVNLKQYFRTASTSEAASIDAGAAGPGWSRTGDNFVAWVSSASGVNVVDVCRFYGSQSPGPNSHFFTANMAECNGLKALQVSTPATQARWNYEGLAFGMQLPQAGSCPTGAKPIYRNYNQGNVKGIDSNHRFTSSLAEYTKTTNAGWIAEGVVMCACDPVSNTACVGLLPSVTPPTMSSWKRLQENVITPKCANCHTAGSNDAKQSGLVLDAAVAYANLINVMPKNSMANIHGMKQIKPGSSALSFFYEKLLLWDSRRPQHFGAAMPLGSQSLSVGELDFIKQWIDSGASDSGDSISPALLNDRTPPAYAPFTPLAPPPVGKGMQITTGQFSINPNYERELFIYRKLANPAPIYVQKFESKMRSNSHHLLAYRIDSTAPSYAMPQADVFRDLRNTDNSYNIATALTMPFHVFVAGAMTPSSAYEFPQGVALELPANTGLDMNAHYVNKTSEPIIGEGFLNLFTVDKTQVSKIARTLFLNNTSFSLPPSKRTTITKSFTFTEGRSVLMLTSHTHQLGEKFVIKIKGGARDGEIVYTSTEWSHPEIVTFDPPLVLQGGQGLTAEATYNNTTNRSVSFGLLSDDEMSIIYGYYY